MRGAIVEVLACREKASDKLGFNFGRGHPQDYFSLSLEVT